MDRSFPVLKGRELDWRERRCNADHFGGDKNIADA